MPIQKKPSCADEQETTLLSVDQAFERISSILTPIIETEDTPVRDCLQRVLGIDQRSPINVPSYTNSAMDGYAINGADIPDAGQKVLTLAGTASAGHPYPNTVKQNQAIRIMTGAPMPQGTDTVIMQEHVLVREGGILIDNSTAPGKNVRHLGEDVNKGSVALTKGTLLLPAHMGLLASLGISVVSVIRRPRVAFFSTGDELTSVSEQLAEQPQLKSGQVFDSNRFTLFGMLKRLNVEIIDLGIVPDDEDQIKNTFYQAKNIADIVITSGGVSVGDADYVSKILHETGDIAFWKLAMRPGRPLACGHMGKAVFFGLPGNPVAVMITFYEFVQPAIQRLCGNYNPSIFSFKVKISTDLRTSSGRTEYQRGILYTNEDGESFVKTTGKQGAGRLSSLCAANCIIVIPPNTAKVRVGDYVNVQPFFGLV